MSSEISDWISLTALVTAFIAYLDTKKAADSGAAVQALTHVIEASERTQTYLARRASGQPRHQNTEWELAEMWSLAAFQISHIDSELSVRLNAKGRFWRAPGTWTPTLRASKQIDLESVTKEARRVMRAYAYRQRIVRAQQRSDPVVGQARRGWSAMRLGGRQAGGDDAHGCVAAGAVQRAAGSWRAVGQVDLEPQFRACQQGLALGMEQAEVANASAPLGQNVPKQQGLEVCATKASDSELAAKSGC